MCISTIAGFRDIITEEKPPPAASSVASSQMERAANCPLDVAKSQTAGSLESSSPLLPVSFRLICESPESLTPEEYSLISAQVCWSFNPAEVSHDFALISGGRSGHGGGSSAVSHQSLQTETLEGSEEGVVLGGGSGSPGRCGLEKAERSNDHTFSSFKQ